MTLSRRSCRWLACTGTASDVRDAVCRLPMRPLYSSHCDAMRQPPARATVAHSTITDAYRAAELRPNAGLQRRGLRGPRAPMRGRLRTCAYDTDGRRRRDRPRRRELKAERTSMRGRCTTARRSWTADLAASGTPVSSSEPPRREVRRASRPSATRPVMQPRQYASSAGALSSRTRCRDRMAGALLVHDVRAAPGSPAERPPRAHPREPPLGLAARTCDVREKSESPPGHAGGLSGRAGRWCVWSARGQSPPRRMARIRRSSM